MDWATVQTRTAIIYGIIGGMAGGVGMAMWMMVKSAAVGQGFWTPLSMCMASFVYRNWAKTMMDEMMQQQQGKVMVTGFEGIHGVVGIILHMAVSAGFGLVFALALSRGLGRRLATAGTIAAAVVYGLGIWVVMQFAVLPVINKLMLDNIETMVGTWAFVVAHMVFGLILGAVVGWEYRTQLFQSRAVHVA
jgi:hypothetical protein